MRSPLWDQLDPGASLRVVSDAPGSGSTAELTPSTVAPQTALWSPNHPMFGFGLFLGLTALALYYATERGAGAGVEAHLGKLHASADADMGGSEK